LGREINGGEETIIVKERECFRVDVHILDQARGVNEEERFGAYINTVEKPSTGEEEEVVWRERAVWQRRADVRC
jgi:hypothetical protein